MWSSQVRQALLCPCIFLFAGYVLRSGTAHKVKQKLEIKNSNLAEDSHLAAQKLHRLRCERGLAAASHECLLCLSALSGLLMHTLQDDHAM